MDHQERAGAPVRAIVGVGVAHVDREIVLRIRIHQAGADGVESLRRLTVAFLDLRSELARPAADRVAAKKRKAPVLVLLPDLELGLFLEDSHQDRRILFHVPLFDLGQHALGQRLQVPAADLRGTVGIAAGKRDGSRNRSGRHQRAHQGPMLQSFNPRTRLPKPSPLNGYPQQTLATRRNGCSPRYDGGRNGKIRNLSRPNSSNTPQRRRYP